jgi:general secretion pathway protein D
VGTVTFPSISAYVNALRTDTDATVISTPQILGVDNEEATVEVGQSVPYVQTDPESGVSLYYTSRRVEYKDVGVSLSVTPHTSRGDKIKLAVKLDVKAVIESTALGGTVLAPTTSTRSTKTTFVLDDGETAVIGGIAENRASGASTQTPCLGRIPVVGWFFKGISDQDSRRALMVFMTARVIKPPDGLNAISRDKKKTVDDALEEGRRRW